MIRNRHAGKPSNGGLDFRVLGGHDIERIHAATLEVLRRTGVFVEDEESLERYGDAGCVVDPVKKIVKIPGYLVEDAIRSAPGVALMAGRHPKDDFLLEPGRVSFSCFGTAVSITDPRTREIRPSTKADLEECARVIDYLDNVDTNRRSVSAYDVPQEVAAVHDAEALLNNTTKHILTTPYNGYMARQIIKMLAAIAGGEDQLRERPLMTLNNCAITPLKLPRECCEIIRESCRVGMTVTVLSQALAGGSAPVTLAGTLVMHNTEVLAGLVLTQLYAKGNPFLYSSSTCTLDLRYGTAAVGNPETALLNSALAEMARYYTLPCRLAGG